MARSARAVWAGASVDLWTPARPFAEPRPSGPRAAPRSGSASLSSPAASRPASHPSELGTPHPRLLGDRCRESPLSWRRKTPPEQSLPGPCREARAPVHALPRPLRALPARSCRGFRRAPSTRSMFGGGYETGSSATTPALQPGTRAREAPAGETPPLATGKPRAFGCGRTSPHVAEPHMPPAAGSTPPDPAPAPALEQGRGCSQLRWRNVAPQATSRHPTGPEQAAGRGLSPARRGAGCSAPTLQSTRVLFLGTPTRGPLWPCGSHT